MTAYTGRGRPPSCSRSLVERICQLRYREGLSCEKIAKLLNAEHVPLPDGGSQWLRSSVDRLLHTRYAAEIRYELGFGE